MDSHRSAAADLADRGRAPGCTGGLRHPQRRLGKTNPRFTGENFQRNLRIVDEVTAVAARRRYTAHLVTAEFDAVGDGVSPPRARPAWSRDRGDVVAWVSQAKAIEASFSGGLEWVRR
jgi:hypothetical protein